jgi:GT2 family glycosyltransferase
MSSTHPATPRVSIGLPVYNGEQFLAEALDAILAQTFEDFDVLTVDNASTDRTGEIGQAYAARDARIAYRRNHVNIGAMRNFNLSFRRTRGAYFKGWAADDLCMPTFLEACVAALDNRPAATMAYSRAIQIDERSQVTGNYDALLSSPDWTAPAPERYRALLGELLATNGLTAPIYVAGLIRRSALERTKLLGSYIGADLTLVSELALAGEIVEVPEALLAVRAHAGSSSFGEATGTPETMHEFINPGKPTHQSFKDRLSVLHTRGRRFPAFVEAVMRSPLPLPTRLALAAETVQTIGAFLWSHRYRLASR